MPVVWDPKRWWNLCQSEDENKEIKPIFTEKCRKFLQRASVV